jgi:DNA-binding transcriptional MerR regulator
MPDSLDIAEVARLTGLTSRALRFYEARGLVAPLRTASGRRHFGPAELERLHQIVAMKRAGLTLAQIQAMTAGRRLDLRSIVIAQIEVLSDREREIAGARALLETILSRIDRSEPIDVATFCSLIRQGDIAMPQDKWDELTSRYMSPNQKEALRQSVAALPADFDNAAHNAKWKDLSDRIKAALPMDPASPRAQAFLDEWDELIRPFLAVATPEMLAGVRNLHENIEQWEGEIDSPFDAEVYRFHQAAAEARKAGNG